jgi:hypothetical protein
MRVSRILRLSAVVFYFLASFALHAQSNTTGALVGTVADSSGAVVTNAAVILTSQSTGQTRSIHSDNRGLYRFALLAPGLYDVEASADSFRSSRKGNIEINVSNTLTVNFVLTVSAQKEEVVVHDEAQLVQSESSTIGGVVDAATIENLPLSTRNYTQILDLSTGVQADVNNAGNLGRNTQDVFVNGAPEQLDQRFGIYRSHGHWRWLRFR